MVKVKEEGKDEIFELFYRCEDCGFKKIQEGFVHCPECGQVIDWEEV